MITITLSACNCTNCRRWVFAAHPEALTMADADERRKAWEATRVVWRGEHPNKPRTDEDPLAGAAE